MIAGRKQCQVVYKEKRQTRRPDRTWY